MLEIKNLTKIYRTKGGAEVRAVDGVSLKFEEKGMVFLLGKSGSGKSTLLNLCGGLDMPDSGEIIIKGRSSRDFSQADFDGYRNTFVGFVFQEYNILNEFSVADNIAVALELQGRGRDRAEVERILKEVDLENFASRKPNTLSGGQKQRVAIARALVKSPHIIMADEPTGALDSVTGRQVLETLKKLSADKLVIVVSHDREFAEVYGDRIIELSDGKVISDVTKERVAPTPAGDNLSFIGGDTIAVKSGASLTPGDVERINEFLRSCPKDLIISCGEREISSFKKAARISDDGSRERFRETQEGDIEQKKYSEKDSAFIRSSLPLRHAVRIGASSLKVKPLRLFFTIFLTFIAFTFFGLFSTLTFYDPVETAVSTYMASEYSALPVQKLYTYTVINYYNGEENNRSDTYAATDFTPEEFAEYSEIYGDKTLAVFDYNADYYSSGFAVYNAGRLDSSYYTVRLDGFARFNEDAWSGSLVAGRLTGLFDDEIVISSYLADGILEAGLEDENGDEIALRAREDLVGRQLVIDTNSGDRVSLTVAGIFGLDMPRRFDSLREGNDDYNLVSDLNAEMYSNAYLTVLVGEGFYAAHEESFQSNIYRADYGMRAPARDIYLDIASVYGSAFDSPFVYGINSLPVSSGDDPARLFFVGGREEYTLSDGEVVVSASMFSQVLVRLAELRADEMYAALDAEYPGGDPEYDAGMEEAAAYLEDMSRYIEMAAGGYYYDEEADDYVEPLQSEVYEGAREIAELLSWAEEDDLTIPVIFGDGTAFKELKVVGFYCYPMTNSIEGVYLSVSDFTELTTAYPGGSPNVWSSEIITSYIRPEGAIYSSIIVPFPAGQSALRSLISLEYNPAADSSFVRVTTSLSSQLRGISSVIDLLGTVFLWIGVVMAVFAMLLLFNFISVSISYKKREIGILRAVGARSADVFKIFYSESFIIAAICFVLAMIVSFVVCGVLNTIISPVLGVNLFVFGPLSWLVMLAIAVATSVIATFLPVWSIARKRPVESIRAL